MEQGFRGEAALVVNTMPVPPLHFICKRLSSDQTSKIENEKPPSTEQAFQRFSGVFQGYQELSFLPPRQGSGFVRPPGTSPHVHSWFAHWRRILHSSLFMSWAGSLS